MCQFKCTLKSFATELYKINAIKFGDFKTKVGLQTPVYCDLRVIISYPELLNVLAELIIERINQLEKFDVICGVPYTALPIATAVSIKNRMPMVMRRKEVKEYGTKQSIEGHFKEGNNCLIIEDVVTSGSSILETVKDLRKSGMKCTDAIVLLNREQGGEKLLLENGIKMHALLSLTELMKCLQEANHINMCMVEKVQSYLSSTQVDPTLLIKHNRLKLSFEERINFAQNSAAKELMEIIFTKKTTLCVAADLTSTTDLLNLADQVGPHICVFKTHVDIVEDFHPDFIKHLQEIANKHNFMLFEDRKFSDIGKTVQLQYTKSIYQISSWATLVTAHSVMGKGVLDALQEVESLEKRGILLLAEASSAGSLTDDSYIEATLKLVKEYSDIITGVVCQRPLLVEEPGFIQLTPGCHLEFTADNLSQQYNSPEVVVLDKGADIAVVGRGITQAADVAGAALKYKECLWSAYEKRILQ